MQALTWIGWGPANGRDEAMFDGDPTTAFLGMEIGEAIMASYSKNHSLLTWGGVFYLSGFVFIRGFVSLTIVLSNAS